MEPLDVFAYLDYRAFCRDFYNTKKKKDPAFSYRSFGKRASVAPSYLKHVIDGRRNLSPQMSQRFAFGMGLTADEASYFENLIRFNQAQSLEEKNLYLGRLQKKRAKSLRSFGMAEAAALLSHWYVVAIKELVVSLNTDDTSAIQSLLRVKLSEAVISKTIHDLKELGWLQKEGDRWTSVAYQIRFPDEVKSYVVRSFHKQMLEISVEALQDDLTEREFGAAVFTFPHAKMPELKEKVKELQQDLIQFVQSQSENALQSDSGDQKVYYFGVQCFSLQNSAMTPRGET